MNNMFSFFSKTKKTQDNFLCQRKLLAIVENLRDGLIMYSPQFEILEFNPAAENIFSVKKDEVLGMVIEPKLNQIEKFKSLTQVIYPSLASSVSQLSEASVWPQIIEISIEEQNKNFYTVLNRITDENGKIICFLKIVKDETREQAILQSKNEFINTAAHQLRTPLTALNWALENILKFSENSSPEIHDVATEAIKVSERTLKITNDLLDVAKIEEGKFGYSFKNVDIVVFVNGIIDAVIPFAHQHSTQITFSHPNINELYVAMDPDRLGLALFNLIDNAVKYTVEQGVVSILLEKNENLIKISIQDSGVGIPENEREKIFKKFYRATNAAQVEPNGNGLGLFITQNIIKRHGGDIGFESRAGRGTTFWFTLPIKSVSVGDESSVFKNIS
ncbi:MAG: ATP-binding protein [Patescibacteria group bacterium]